VPFELAFWPQADEALTRLENDPGLSSALSAVNRVLDRLEEEPTDLRLGNTLFKTPEYGNVSAADARCEGWYVPWKPGPEEHVIDVVAIAQLP
jgi:hypothetical protein